MTNKRKKIFAVYFVYLIIVLAIIWQGYGICKNIISLRDFKQDLLNVTITGNVLKPGLYRVPSGTTHFEILKVAGVLPNSDILSFNLASQLSDSQTIEVGTKSEPVTLKKDNKAIRLEFFFGAISVISSDGKSRPIQRGLEINVNDRLLTEENSQAELSVSNFSRIDVDNFSELNFDKINSLENNKEETWIFQKSGTSWYKIVYGNKNEVFKVSTPSANITVAGTGADFIVSIKQDRVEISNFDGLVFIERLTQTEALNLISGQSVNVFMDNRPFQVNPIMPENMPAERFSQLSKEKSVFILKHIPYNFLFCGLPGLFVLGSIKYDENKIYITNIPHQLSVADYILGCSTLDQAFLYGGPVLVSTVLEQIMSMRIPKYLILEKEDLIRILQTLGGLEIDVDDKAASVLNIPKGKQKLSSKQLSVFLKPSLTGFEDFKNRQMKIMGAIVDALSSKNIVLTIILAQQLLANIQTNISPSDLMEEYNKFITVKNWDIKEISFPAYQSVRDGKNVLEPKLEECKKLFEQE